MDLTDKLRILADSAKFDAACTSSGIDRKGIKGMLGNACAPGICHSFAADGRCISLLKVLMTNICIYDCQYCINRASNDVQRAAFTPDELADITIGFYRRNYIEGLFLSSGVIQSPDAAMERMCKAIEILRTKYQFNGYIHSKAIPGCSQELVDKLGRLSDRISINIEMPSEKSLSLLAPNKTKQNILKPMSVIRDSIVQSKQELAVYRHAAPFAPSGQSTQMIVGATPDTDYQIMRLSEGLYNKYRLRRVFYSAYIPVGTNALLPQNVPPPLLREHRLYQTDWLIRKYGFTVNEILDEQHPSLDPLLDPKCNWAIQHLDQFPVDINRADKELLLRIPGIGVTSANRILTARRLGRLKFEDLKKMGIVLKRAMYFITCGGGMMPGVQFTHPFIYQNLTADVRLRPGDLPIEPPVKQLTWYDTQALLPMPADVRQSLTGQM